MARPTRSLGSAVSGIEGGFTIPPKSANTSALYPEVGDGRGIYAKPTASPERGGAAFSNAFNGCRNGVADSPLL